MFGLSAAHLVIVALVVVILFGRGRVSDLMGDFGKGIQAFKRGVNSGEETMLTNRRIGEIDVEGSHGPERHSN